MISVKNIIRSSFVATVTALGFYSCANDMFEAPDADGMEYDSDTQLVINLTLPEASYSTRSESTPSSDECAVNSVSLIAFNTSGDVEFRSLPLPSEIPVSPSGTPVYQIKSLTKGDYRIFVLANIPENLINNVTSEKDLKEVIMDYSESLPQAGNLPMVYEPSASTYIPSEAELNPTVQTLSLKFACVKIRYNIIFDKDIEDTKSIFGNNGLLIKTVKLENVSKTSYILTRTDKLPDVRTATASGSYYDDYTNTAANSSVNNAFVVNGSGSALSKPSDFNSKWLWQGEIYVPERYVTSASDQTRLSIEAYVPDESGNEGSLRCNYTINLGQYDGASSSALSLERNTLLEVIGTVKTLGNAELDTKIVVKDWMEQLLPAYMAHTYLSLSKTKLSVRSLENDELTYTTDGRGGVEIVCETTLPFDNSNGKAALIFEENQQTGVITVKVNPEVDITTLGSERTGTATCYIKAGNIKKYFEVDYDITPFFILDETTARIQWDDDQEIRTKYFTYTTNLGGLIITDQNDNVIIQPATRSESSYTYDVSESARIYIYCANPSAATGSFIIRSDKNPGTTQVQYLKAYPYNYSKLSDADKNEMDNNGMENLTITLMPPLGDYRIYFRPINDYHVGSRGSASSSEYLNGKSYPYGDTWIDFWDNTGNNSINTDTHRIYIYTQIGETTGTSINSPVWEFTETYANRGETMEVDSNNTGWYYYDLGYNKTPKNITNESYATDYQKSYYYKPRPGETLMIFTNGYDQDLGYTLHRASHHLDPGISLFDFEDREGYVVYDPTCEPYYFIYDEKPEIEDKTYTIYSDCQLTEWYIRYGNASNSVPTDAQRYTLYSKSITSTKVNGMWKNTFVLKNVKGENSKAIILKFDLTTNVNGYTTPSQRVYLGMYDTDWSRPPRAYFYTSSGSYTSWDESEAMTLLSSGDGNVYYIDVPSGYENGKVIFASNDRNKQTSSDGYQLEKGVSKITYTNNQGYWIEYGTTSSSTVESMIFNGRPVTSDIYFNASTSQWSTSKNF